MPSQTQIYFDNNTLYTRYEAVGAANGGLGTTISYYGYSVPGADDSTPSFSIKKVYYLSNVQYVDWNDHEIGAYRAIWNNRGYYFATPSAVSLTGSTSFNGFEYQITFAWNSATGASKYNIKLYEDLRYIVTPEYAGDDSIFNVNHQNGIVRINENSITLNKCRLGHTYSINIYPYNGIANGPVSTLSLNFLG